MDPLEYNARMSAFRKYASSFFMCAYAWVLSLFFGMILLDIRYSHLIPDTIGASAEIADLLLVVVFIVVLFALAAVAASWASKDARNFFLASFAAVLLELFTPLLLSPFIRNIQGLAIGPWLRVLFIGSASVLALIGMVKFLWKSVTGKG